MIFQVLYNPSHSVIDETEKKNTHGLGSWSPAPASLVSDNSALMVLPSIHLLFLLHKIFGDVNSEEV